MEPTELQRHLVEAATACSGELEVDGLLQQLRGALLVLPSWHRAGLGVYDPEWKTYTTHIFTPRQSPSAPSATEEEVDAGQLVPLRVPRHISITNEMPDEQRTPLDTVLLASSTGCYASAPLLLRDRLLGNLFVGFAGSGPIPPDVPPFLERLARIITPVLWNCHMHDRFQRGDRRRDMLVELSNAINTSLKLPTVLDSARQAIQRLAGHCFSAVNLLESGETAYRSYRSLSAHQPPTDEKKPRRFPLSGTALEWVLQHGQSYQSDDLHQHLTFQHDTELRELGVRRYVAAPMFVRGRIIGCFLMGSTDQHRVLPIDVWLYENIALQLALAIDNARQLEHVEQLSEDLRQQNVYLREEIQSEHDFSEMIGQSHPMRRVREAIARVAVTDSTVLITGETGVGKELVARAVHAASPRAEHPMVKVNCAAIPEGMVESELFGHERGAFTSAAERRIGRFELARDGTLFLDEIGELSPAVQAKLLRVLQDGEFERVGGTQTLTSDARIIAATNRDPLEAVEDGTFRSDLYYRLNVFPIEVPTLRARRDDIPLLAEAFVRQFNRRMGKHIQAIDPAAMVCLCRRDWLGNIRELRHEIERAMILSDGTTLNIDCRAAEHPTADSPQPVSPETDLGTLKQIEADHIRRALEQTGGVIEGDRGAARLLGLKPSTLRFRMKRLGIVRPT